MKGGAFGSLWGLREGGSRQQSTEREAPADTANTHTHTHTNTRTHARTHYNNCLIYRLTLPPITI